MVAATAQITPTAKQPPRTRLDRLTEGLWLVVGQNGEDHPNDGRVIYVTMNDKFIINAHSNGIIHIPTAGWEDVECVPFNGTIEITLKA